MTYPTLSDKLRGGWKAANRKLDLAQTNQVLIEVAKGLNRQRAIDEWPDAEFYSPTPQLHLQFKDITNGYAIPQTLAILTRPGSQLLPTLFRVTGRSVEIDIIRDSLINKYCDSERWKIVGKIFDAAQNRVHSRNPLKRFLNGFKNPGPQILE